MCRSVPKTKRIKSITFIQLPTIRQTAGSLVRGETRNRQSLSVKHVRHNEDYSVREL